MFRCAKTFSFIAVLIFLTLFLGCGPSPEDARQQLKQAGLTVSSDALIKSIHTGNARAVHLLLSAGLDPNKPDNQGKTALMEATVKNRGAIVNNLLAKGADPNAKPDKYGQTALIMATIKGHTDIVKTLLAHGADPELRDHDGLTALDYARKLDHQSLIQVLEQARRK